MPEEVEIGSRLRVEVSELVQVVSVEDEEASVVPVVEDDDMLAEGVWVAETAPLLRFVRYPEMKESAWL